MCLRSRFYCHLGRQSLTRSKIVVQYNGMLIPLIYDKKRHCIVTVLTMEMLSAEERATVSEAGEFQDSPDVDLSSLESDIKTSIGVAAPRQVGQQQDH